MIEFVNAKLNLGLNIVGKRSDGYHNLETIFLPVGQKSRNVECNNPLCDILEIIKSNDDNDEFITFGNTINCQPEKNLVWKAYQAFKNACPTEISKHKIYLEKHLPDGAGMGGGSANATFTLKLLNKLHDNILSEDKMFSIALSLGADCPFFIYNSPCFASGIGEILEPIDINLNGYWIAIVKPEVSISTKEAFSMITPKQPNTDLRDLVKLPIEVWKEHIFNDFEHSMFSLHPEISKIKECLYDNGAIYASMTGSGSAFFGIFSSKEDAEKAINKSDCKFKCVVEF